MTVGDPGVQGDVVTGIQGCGVNTPKAADVAAATWGFDKVTHMPNGITFLFGTLSMIVAAGCPAAKTLFSGVTVKADGAIPKEHVNCALFTTS